MWQIYRPRQKTDSGFAAMVEDLQRPTGRSILFSIPAVCLIGFFTVAITTPSSMFDTVFRGNFFARGAAIAIIMLILVSILVVPYIIHSVRQGART
jgi:hypothetical protein